MLTTPQARRHTLSAFDDEIARLCELLDEMGRRAAGAVELSLQAMASEDLALARRVIEEDDLLDEAEIAVEKLVVTMLALRSPMADDLRMLVASLRIAAVLERVGDYAKNIARRVESVAGAQPKAAMPTIAAMGREASAMVRLAVDAFLLRDVAAACEVVARDDAVDGAWRTLRHDLGAGGSRRAGGTGTALDLLLVGQHLERIGDHATNIAEAVYLMVTGERMPEPTFSQAA
jgi:phosphate transport system protein